jgi:Methyltransferase domain
MAKQMQYDQLSGLCNSHFNNQIVGIEIGTGTAQTLEWVLEHSPNLKLVYTIDPYIHDDTSQFEAFAPVEKQEEWKEMARVRLDKFTDRVIKIIDTSDNAVALTPNEVDFVWIDGDHTPGQIRKDLVNYYPKVRLGGIFGGHDYQHVIPLLREMIEGVIFLGDDWTWWVIKDRRELNV